MNDVTIAFLGLILYLYCCAALYTINENWNKTVSEENHTVSTEKCSCQLWCLWYVANRALLLMERAGRWRNIEDLQVTGNFIIVNRLEIWHCFDPLKRPTSFELVAVDVKQANSQHHKQEILLQIDTNTVKNEFDCYFHQPNSYTISHWLLRLAGQQMRMQESTNTAEKCDKYL